KRSDPNLAQTSHILHRRSLPLGVGGSMRRNAGRIENPPSTAVLLNFIDLRRGQPSIDQHAPYIKVRRCQQDDRKCPTVLADNHDTVAGPDAQLMEPHFSLRHSRSQFSVSPLTGRLNERQALGRTLSPRLDYIADSNGKLFKIVTVHVSFI